ncbi:hypothetical protein ACK9YZ_23750 [Rhizobium sp. ZK1]|uniref:hypothetical protein n=1 Tax=Rhizobium sp. ZK1 TaxID=3389872 RepID=UPI0039F73045
MSVVPVDRPGGYLLAVPRDSPHPLRAEIDIEDLRAEKISIASDLPADFLLREIQQCSAE